MIADAQQYSAEIRKRADEQAAEVRKLSDEQAAAAEEQLHAVQLEVGEQRQALAQLHEQLDDAEQQLDAARRTKDATETELTRLRQLLEETSHELVAERQRLDEVRRRPRPPSGTPRRPGRCSGSPMVAAAAAGGAEVTSPAGGQTEDVATEAEGSAERAGSDPQRTVTDATDPAGRERNGVVPADRGTHSRSQGAAPRGRIRWLARRPRWRPVGRVASTGSPVRPGTSSLRLSPRRTERDRQRRPPRTPGWAARRVRTGWLPVPVPARSDPAPARRGRRRGPCAVRPARTSDATESRRRWSRWP